MLLVTTLGGLILGMDVPAPGSRSSKTISKTQRAWWTCWKSAPEALEGALLTSVDPEAHLRHRAFPFVGACSALHLLEMADLGVSYVSHIKDPTRTQFSVGTIPTALP